MLASIDIGTNSILLLIAEAKDNELVPVYQEARIARLGEGVGHTKLLGEEAQERAFEILSDYARLCSEHGVKKIVACGTAALRNARNAKGFVERVERELGIIVDIISEKREAGLSFSANAASFGDDIVVMDIGGGSTEFIVEGKPVSLSLGVVTLTELFIHDDPPAENEIAALKAHVDTLLKRELDRCYYSGNVPRLVAAAGTPTTLAAIRDAIDPYDPERVHGSTLTLNDIDTLVGRLQKATLEERRAIPGLQEGREDVILAGTVLLREAMDLLGFNEAIVSDRGVRWGMLYEKLQG